MMNSMVMLWFACTLLVLIALALVLWPLFQPTKKSYFTEEALQIKLYKERRATLEQELASTAIDETEFKLATAELDFALLQELPSSSPKPQAYHRDYRLIVLIAILFPITSFLLYWHWGHSQALSAFYAQQRQEKLVQTEIKKLGTPDHVINVLKQHLQQDPNSARGWYLLGRLYLEQQQFQPAIDALARANHLKPNDPKIMLSYAESLYTTNQGILPVTGSNLVHKLLQRNPNDINVMGLLALSDYHQKNYQAAIAWWQKIAMQLPPGSDDSKMLAALIAKVQLQQDPNQKPVELQVHVTLAPSLISKVSPQDVVFVYATGIGGSKIPLAVVRYKVEDLPLTLTLDQADAMLPTATLANAKQVVIYARISKSRQPLPQTGDLIGESQVINVREPPKIISIMINHWF